MDTVKLILGMILGTDYKKAPWDWRLHNQRMFMQYVRMMTGVIVVLCIPFLFLATKETVIPFFMCSLVYIVFTCICRFLRW
jgi:hypothetical protein